MDPQHDQGKTNRFELGFESLNQFMPDSQPSRSTGVLPAHQSITQRIPNPVDRPVELPVYAPSLIEIVDELAPMPAQTLILGLTDDDLPVLFDLVSPNTGSILLIGGPGSGKSRLAHSIVSSGCLGQPARRFRFCILSDQPEDIYALSHAPHCYRVAHTGDPEVYALLVELVNLAEERRYGNKGGPTILLSIGDLAHLVNALTPELRDLLFWLVCHGPEGGIWTMAELDPDRLVDFAPEDLESFATWLVGNLDGSHPGNLLQNQDLRRVVSGLVRGGQFCVYTGDQWTPFWIPNPNEDAWRINS